MKDFTLVVLLGALVLVGAVVWLMLPKTGAAPSTMDTGQPAVDSGAASALNVSLSEFSFTADGQNPNDPIHLVAGQPYTITFANNGTIEHEVLAGNGELLHRDDGTPDGYTNNFFEGLDVSVIYSSGESSVTNNLDEIELEPGESATLTLTLPSSYAGQIFEIGCFVRGHYEAGMKAPLLVE